MPTKRQRIVLVALGSIYLMAIGALIGVVAERVRFDAVRTRVVRDLQDAAQRARDRVMTLERHAPDRAQATTTNASP